MIKKTRRSLRKNTTTKFIKFNFGFSFLWYLIEFVWKWAKQEYRSWVDWFRANGMKWNETQLVEIIMDSIPTDVAIKETKRGFANI